MDTESESASPAAAHAGYRVGGAYAWYVLGVCTTVYTFSLADRQILSILSTDIKLDLHLSDAELGVLYGTVFAVFYALFGIPLGRLADGWVRTRLMALGLLGWSLTTVAGGFAGSFVQLGAARAGVAVGEATVNPTACSLLSDWFPRSQRATAIALYSCGVSIGLGASLVLGGSVVGAWKAHFGPGPGPFGLRGWQAAFLVAGTPGILLAALVATLREPPRGLSEGIATPREPHPFRSAAAQLVAIVPPFSLLRLLRLGATWRQLALALATLVGVVILGVLATYVSESLVPASKLRTMFMIGGFRVTSHVLQWSTLSLGLYAVLAWLQSLRLSDRANYLLMAATPASLAIYLAAAAFITINYGLMAWSAVYAITHFHAPVADVGLAFGAITATTGLAGTALGGWLADVALRYSPRGRLFVSLVSTVVAWPLAAALFDAPSLHGFYWRFAALSLVTTAWLPGAVSTAQDLVLPRMRGASAAALNMATTMIGLGLGPFLVGLVSDRTGNLATGILSLYWLSPVVWACFAIAIMDLPHAMLTRLEKARKAEKEAVLF